MREQKRSLLRQTELLIIDEVSMLRADMLDAIDTVLRHVRRRSDLPFGGVQMLFIGDLLQLPPVVKDEEWNLLKTHYPNMWFFNAKVLQQNQPLYLELETVYRQQDQEFIQLLNNLRSNTLGRRDVELLQSRYQPEFRPPANQDYITLTTHNAIADKLNQTSLEELKGELVSYGAAVTGEFSEYAYPIEPKLSLKVGAQIMFIKNDPSGMKQFFNGRIGFISSLTKEEIFVGFNDGSPEFSVQTYEWQNMRYSLNAQNEIEENIIGTFTQYPLKLAWAVTIHKSQGLTFDRAVVDIGSAFAPGQIYVALSRLRSLEGLVMKSPLNTSRLGVDRTVEQYSENKEKPEILTAIAEKESYTYLKEYLHNAFDLSPLLASMKRHVDNYHKDEALSAKQKYQKKAIAIKEELSPILEVADKFIAQMDYILRQPKDQAMDVLKVRLEAANTYFLPLLRKIDAAFFKLMKEVKENEKKVKTYMEELLLLEADVFEQQKKIRKSAVLMSLLAEGKDLTKNEMQNCVKDAWRDEQLKEIQWVKYSAKATEKTTKTKLKTGTSRKLSMILFKDGKSIENIADLRNLTPATIESHLAYFVKRGELDAADIIGDEKLGNIQSVMERTQAKTAAEIIKYLGEDYSWGDVRIAMAQTSAEG